MQSGNGFPKCKDETAHLHRGGSARPCPGFPPAAILGPWQSGKTAAAGKRVQPYFSRMSDGYEPDLLLDRGTDRRAVAVKLTSDPSTDMIARLHKTADLVDGSRRILICRIPGPIENPKLLVTDLAGWLRRLLA